MSSKITEYFHNQQMKQHREEPDFESNKKLIELIVNYEKELKTEYHLNERKIILKSLKELEETNLKYIPLDVLNNSFTSIVLYFELLIEMEKDSSIKNNKDMNKVFIESYNQTTKNINKFLNINDMI